MAKEKKLPQQPEKLSDIDLGHRGQEAESFKASPEYAYLMALLGRLEAARLWDKLSLSATQGEALARLCAEIDLLAEIRTSVERDINVGRAAREREDAKVLKSCAI